MPIQGSRCREDSLSQPLSRLLVLKRCGYRGMPCFILTDSGGLHKGPHFFCAPYITLVDETQWVERRLRPLRSDNRSCCPVVDQRHPTVLRASALSTEARERLRTSGGDLKQPGKAAEHQQRLIVGGRYVCPILWELSPVIGTSVVACGFVGLRKFWVRLRRFRNKPRSYLPGPPKVDVYIVNNFQ